MASYRVFEFPFALPQEKAGGDNLCFVRDRFSFPAFFFPALWLLWQRLWLVFAAFLILMAFFLFLIEWISPVAVFLLHTLLGLYIGFEGTNLKALKLKRRGWQETGVIIAGSEEEAEVRFFSTRKGAPPRTPDVTLPAGVLQSRSTPLPSARGRTTSSVVIGGFPTHPHGSRS